MAAVLALSTLAACAPEGVVLPGDGGGVTPPDGGGGTPPDGSGGTPPDSPPPTTGGQPAGSVSVRDFGAKGDGVTDDTTAIRAAAATGKPIWFPWTDAHYKITGTIELKDSAFGDARRPEIRFYGANGDPANGGENNSQNIFLVRNYQGSGMVIDSLHLNGGWNGVPTARYGDWSPVPPQWSHGIRIMAPSKNVTVRNSWIEKPVGDCIAISWYAPVTQPARNIVIENTKMTNPWRNTVTIIGGEDITIRDSYHEDLHDGARWGDPGNFVAVIDLESDPGAHYQYTRNVLIENNVINTNRCWGNPGAISLANASGNSYSGNVAIVGTRGTWVDPVIEIVPGSANAATFNSGSRSWPGTTASNNVRDGNTHWEFKK